jgi:hypothetical protein
LGIDDSRAIQRAIEEAGIAGSTILIVRAQDIVVELIKQGVLSVEAPTQFMWTGLPTTASN